MTEENFRGDPQPAQARFDISLSEGDFLKMGIDLLAAGRLGAAESLYETILARWPASGSAIHGMALVRLREGRIDDALRLFEQASALQSQNASIFSNWADALLAAKKPADAERVARTALSLNSDYPEALFNLGLALLRLYRFDEAEASFRGALAIRPAQSSVVSGLADALREQGKIRSAIDAYREALALDNSNAHAHGNLGLLLQQVGKPVDALEHCRKAVELRPQSALSYNNLGLCLHSLDRFDEALDAYEQGIELDPALPDLCVNVGKAWVEMNDPQEAAGWFQRANRLDPDHEAARCGLAEVLNELGNSEASVELFLAILQNNPKSYAACKGLAAALLEQGDAAGAVAIYEAALLHFPESAILWVALANTLSHSGDLKRAEECYRKALAINPEHAGAYAQLATMFRGKLPDADAAALQALFSAPWVRPFPRAALLFGLAHFNDGRGRFAEAGAMVAEANAIQKAFYEERNQGYDPDENSRHTDRVIATFTKDFFTRKTGYGVESDRPVFVIGMPRSGTTLTEQILASHAQVFGAGERRFAALGFGSLPSRLKHPGPPLTALESLTPEVAVETANWHLSQLAAVNSTAKRVVDKMPDNYQHVGWLALIFPNARFIHTRRNVIDVALSCWTTNFAKIRWANDLEHLARRIQDYQRLMDHWRTLLPGRILDLDYENLVTNQEEVSRKLIEWIGLDWDPACLNFHRTERLVRTASVTQVRQPIYQRSIARWQSYEPFLRPLVDKLQSSR